MRKLSVVVRAEYTVTDAEYDLIYALYTLSDPRKVTAVKFVKNQYNLSLKEAKDICDEIGHNPYLQPNC